jgi:hypothetical protein
MPKRELTDKVTHGTPSTYTNYGCKCPECRRAWAEYRAGYRRPAVESRKLEWWQQDLEDAAKSA